MIFEKEIKVGSETISIKIDSSQPIDWNIRKLKNLCLVTFPENHMYPPTIVHSNIVGIDEALGVFVIGNRFGIYSGYMCSTSGNLSTDLHKYVESFDPDNHVVFTLKPTTYEKIEEDESWITKLLENG